jgi:hypothetical protein
MSCPTVRLFRYSRTHIIQNRKYEYHTKQQNEAPSRPVQDPGLPRRGISKQEFRSQSLNGIFDCSRRRSNTESRCVAARLQSNPHGERRGTVRGAILISTKVPLSTAQLYSLNSDARLEWVVSTTRRPTALSGRRSGTHCTGGWMGPMAYDATFFFSKLYNFICWKF